MLARAAVALAFVVSALAAGACMHSRAPLGASAPSDAGLSDCCTVWADACGCLVLGGDPAGHAEWQFLDASSWRVPIALEEDFADADWHLSPDGTREVVRTNHAMTEVWVYADRAKVHVVHDDGGELRCR